VARTAVAGVAPVRALHPRVALGRALLAPAAGEVEQLGGVGADGQRGQGRGEVQVAVRSFEPRGGGEPAQLIELQSIRTELGDLERRGYWLEVTERRHVSFEAAGRSLGDLRIERAVVGGQRHGGRGRRSALERLAYRVGDVHPRAAHARRGQNRAR